MKYRFTFYSADRIELPVQYNHIMQAAVLNWLGEDPYITQMHDEGHRTEKRALKLYTFSNLLAKYQYNKETRILSFQGEISFYGSFYEERVDHLIEKNIQRKKPLRLGEKNLAFLRCEVIEETYTDCIVEAYSPITIHSTVELPSGKKQTFYYEPQDREFSKMIRENLIHKYKAYYGEEPKNSDFEVFCLPNENYKKASIYYKRFLIIGWRGKFMLRGSEEMMKMALLTGLGARNGIGCGCIKQIGLNLEEL